VTRDEAQATSTVREGPLRPKLNEVLPATTLRDALVKLKLPIGIDWMLGILV